MESSEPASIDDSHDSKNLETPVEEDVAKYEDCDSEALSSQNEDHGNEQILGYLAYNENPSDTVDATIYLDSALNLSGQRIILTSNDEGNGIIVVVSDDPNGQPLEQTFSHASVFHPDDVTFEESLKDERTVDEASQGFEFIETEEVSQEQEERRAYIENSEGVINISSENQSSPVNSSSIESPLWSSSNNTQSKSEGTEMLFIPNPTVVNSSGFVITRDDSKTPKLMQLAYIAQEYESADKKGSNSVPVVEFKDVDSPLGEIEGTAYHIVQTQVAKDLSASYQGQSESNIKDSECLPNDKCEKNAVDTNSKSFKSDDLSSLLSSTSTREIDNTVSVIHTASSELQENLGNQLKNSSSSEYSSVKNFNGSENERELPSEIFSSNMSRMSLQDSLEEPPNPKEMENESARDDMEGNSRLSGSSNESKGEKENVAGRVLDLTCSPDSPITFIEKSQKLDDDALDIDEEPLADAESDIRADIDDDSHADSCIVVVEDDESKGVDDVSNISDTMRENFPIEEGGIKDSDDSKSSQRIYSKKSTVPMETDSECSISDSDVVTNKVHSSSTSKSGLSFLSSKNTYSYKAKRKNSSEVQSHETPLDTKAADAIYQYDSSESNDKPNNSTYKSDESSKFEMLDSQDSPADHLDSDLVIAESAEEAEFNADAGTSNSAGTKPPLNCKIKDTSDILESSPDVKSQFIHPDKEVLENEVSQILKPDQGNDIAARILKPDREKDSPSHILKSHQETYIASEIMKLDQETDIPSRLLQNIQQSNNNNVVDGYSVDPGCSAENDSGDVKFVNNEETLVKPPTKTYGRKKTVKDIESTLNVKEKIELFSCEDLNFSECDKDIQDIENSINMEQQKDDAAASQEHNSPALQERNSECDDLLLSDVQSKVSATYNIKKKSMQPVKQSFRSRRLRPRSLLSKLPLENGSPEASGSEAKKNSFDSSSSENIAWGDVLLRTSFQPSTVSNDVPSTSSVVPSPPKETSTPLVTSEQQKRKSNKLTRDFEKLLNSSPVKRRRQKSIPRKMVPEMKKRARKDKSPLHSQSYTFGYANPPNYASHHESPKTSIPRKKPKSSFEGNQEVKKADIKYLNRRPVNSPSTSAVAQQQEAAPLNFSCSSCSFVSGRVNNLIEHLKYCSNRQPAIDFSVNDAKRQRIRGEDIDSIRNSETLREYINGSLEEVRELTEGEFSGLSHGRNLDSDDDMDLDFMDKKSKFGYGEDDVVWAKVEDRFWPGLVCKLTKRKASVKLINYPREMKGLKISAERVHTFDDAKWNKMLLAEAANMDYNEIFVKAVQTSETFVRKKWLGLNVKGKDFFSLPEEIDFVTDDESSDSNINEEDSDFDEIDEIERAVLPSRKAAYDHLNLEKIKNYILSGKLDEYVASIYTREIRCRRHINYFGKSKEERNLNPKSWFGPCENVFEAILVEYFRKLFLARFGEKYFYISYVCEVWIPEAVIKAIADLGQMSMQQAEKLFDSDESDIEEPSIEEIEKMYS